MEEIARATATLAGLVPGGRALVVRDPLAEDECRWFNIAVDRGLVAFSCCAPGCGRLKQRGAAGPDHFTTPSGKDRHLYSSPESAAPSLNREYVPHIAAWARAVYEFGYDPTTSRFSHYRKYSRDLLTKRAGGDYETDVEFGDPDGRLFLQIEVKKDARQVSRLAAQLDAARGLADLPPGTAKEVEYVLDLAPRYLWVVGPGSLDPAAHVFAVLVDGLNARFDRVECLPPPPTRGAEIEGVRSARR